MGKKRTKDWANTRGELAGSGSAHPPPGSREAGRQQPEPERGWDPEWMTSTGRVAARDQLPRRVIRHTWDGAPWKPSGSDGEGDKMHTRQAPGCLSCSDLGRAQIQAQLSLRLCGVPENLNLSGLDLGSSLNPGPALHRSPAEQPGAWAV